MSEASIDTKFDSDYNKKVAIVVLSWPYLISNLDIKKPLLEQFLKCGLLHEQEYKKFEQLLESNNYDEFIRRSFINLLLTKMLEHCEALKNSNLILIDPLKLFLEVMRTNGPSLKISDYLDDKITKSDVNEKILSYLFNVILPSYTKIGGAINWEEVAIQLESHPKDQKNISFAGGIAGGFFKQKAQSSLFQPKTFWSKWEPKDELDANLAAMVGPMAQMSDYIDSTLDAEQVRAYNKPVKKLSRDLYKLDRHVAADKIDQLYTKTHPIAPDSNPWDVFKGIVKLLYFLYKCYSTAPGSVSREEAVNGVVDWFKIIVQRRLLSFLRTVDWSALWQRVRTNVDAFLRTSVPAVSRFIGYRLGFGFIFVGLGIVILTAFSRRAPTSPYALPFRSTT